jgi:predicted transcriptional regulator
VSRTVRHRLAHILYDKLSYVYDEMSCMLYHRRAVATRPPLANAELSVMELLWDEGRLTARRVRERLYPGAEKAQHGTVQRLLQRLEDKGFVLRERDLGVQLFSAIVSREDYAASQLESLAQRLTGGSIAPLVTHLIEERRLTRSEIERLRRILDEGGPDGEAS